MQAKEQKISPIKQRILQFADSIAISKREFYLKIGVSRGTLESKTGITEDVVAKFIATYPVINPDWLLTGNGPMLRSGEVAVSPKPVDFGRETILLKEMLLEKDKEIWQLNREIGALEEKLGAHTQVVYPQFPPIMPQVHDVSGTYDPCSNPDLTTSVPKTPDRKTQRPTTRK